MAEILLSMLGHAMRFVFEVVIGEFLFFTARYVLPVASFGHVRAVAWKDTGFFGPAFFRREEDGKIGFGYAPAICVGLVFWVAAGTVIWSVLSG